MRQSSRWERERVRRTWGWWPIVVQSRHVEGDLRGGRFRIEWGWWRGLVRKRRVRLELIRVRRDLLERGRVVFGEPWASEDDLEIRPDEEEEEEAIDGEEGDWGGTREEKRCELARVVE